MDREKDISPSFASKIVTENLNADQTTARLDQVILYLRRVHLFDYYSGIESDSMLALQHRAGNQPERAPYDGAFLAFGIFLFIYFFYLHWSGLVWSGAVRYMQ